MHFFPQTRKNSLIDIIYAQRFLIALCFLQFFEKSNKIFSKIGKNSLILPQCPGDSFPGNPAMPLRDPVLEPPAIPSYPLSPIPEIFSAYATVCYWRVVEMITRTKKRVEADEETDYAEWNLMMNKAKVHEQNAKKIWEKVDGKWIL